MTFVRRSGEIQLANIDQVVGGSTNISVQRRIEFQTVLHLDNPDTEPDFRMDLVCLGIFACSCKGGTFSDSEDEGPTRYLEAFALRPRDSGKHMSGTLAMTSTPRTKQTSSTA